VWLAASLLTALRAERQTLLRESEDGIGRVRRYTPQAATSSRMLWQAARLRRMDDIVTHAPAFVNEHDAAFRRQSRHLP